LPVTRDEGVEQRRLLQDGEDRPRQQAAREQRRLLAPLGLRVAPRLAGEQREGGEGPADDEPAQPSVQSVARQPWVGRGAEILGEVDGGDEAEAAEAERVEAGDHPWVSAYPALALGQHRGEVEVGAHLEA